MEREEEEIKHESFGQIVFTRTNGGSTHFYGSELPQEHYITMSVKQSSVDRNLTDDKYYTEGGRPLIKVRMTSSQFAELITSLNIGDGVPCTIESYNGKQIEEIPHIENRKTFVHKKFESRMKMFAASLKKNQEDARNLVKKKTLSKDDISNLLSSIDWLTTEISSNIPFFAKCFQETMDDVVTEAKMEIENAILHKVSMLGMKALHDENKLLENNQNINVDKRLPE